MIGDDNNITLAEKNQNEKKQKKFWILLACIICPAVLFLAIQKITGRKVLERLSETTTEEISSIDCFRVPQNELVITLKESKELTSIIDILNKLEEWAPQHPQFSKGYDLIVNFKNGDSIKLECMTMDSSSYTYIYIFSESSLGSFKAKSKNLNTWLDSYIAKASKDNVNVKKQ